MGLLAGAMAVEGQGLVSTAGEAKPSAVRWEVHPIATLTLTDHEFLTGSKNGKPATIAGELRFPAGAGPFPAVVLIHGSGGVGSNVDYWAGVFNRMGVAAFVLDCFTGRGITTTIADQSQVGSLAMIYDAYRALELLGKHPKIDKTRIALMGFSKGGFAALYASMRRFQIYYAPPGLAFAAYIPFYPRCDIPFEEDGDVADKPIRIFHGDMDDWVPYGPAKRYAERLRAEKKDVEFTLYRGTRHSFDSLTYPGMYRFEDAEIISGCKLAERDGYIMNLETGKEFTHQDACITRGASVGGNTESRLAAREAVTALLKKVFSLRDTTP